MVYPYIDKWEQESINSYARGNNTENDYRVLELIKELKAIRAGTQSKELVEIQRLRNELNKYLDLINKITYEIDLARLR